MIRLRHIRVLLPVVLLNTCFAFSVNAGEGTFVGPQQEVDGISGLQPAQAPSQQKALLLTQTGIASWYGGGFVGRKTASGERYRPDDRTAAHRTLPFGTLVRVTNLRNKKAAVVRINNRGPFIKGRIIDLSRQAATDLGIVNTGISRVQVEVLPKEAAGPALALN